MTGSTRSLYEDREGNIWVGLRGGLLRLSEACSAQDMPLEGLTQDGVRTMAVSGDGSVWVATSHNINRFTGDQRTTYPVPQTLNLYSDPQGVMWASTSEGLWRSQGQFRREPVPGRINWGRVLVPDERVRRRCGCAARCGRDGLGRASPSPPEASRISPDGLLHGLPGPPRPRVGGLRAVAAAGPRSYENGRFRR